MGRMWLVIAVLCSVASAADAKRIMCACPASSALPAHGSIDVPINTKVWLLGNADAAYHLDGERLSGTWLGTGGMSVERFDLPRLQPNQLVQLNGDGAQTLTLHTSNQADDSPPPAPRNVNASITVDRNHEVQSIYLFGNYDSDTALIRVDVITEVAIMPDAATGSAPLSFATTPSRLFLCNPGIRLAPGNATLEIRAVDLAGNESPPFVQRIVIDVQESENPCTDGRAHGLRRRGHGYEIIFLFLLAPVLLVGLGIGLLITRAITQARIRKAIPEPVSLLIAEAVARAMLKQHLIVTALTMAASIGLFVFGAAVLAFIGGLVTIVALLNSLKARKILWWLDIGDTVAERRSHWLVVSGPRGFAHLRASDYQFRTANQLNVPTSIAR